jgi:carbon-monoxide dehydrogenase medium subunit
MKPARFAYVRPESIAEAAEHLAVHGSDAALLAGGQSLVPLLSLRLARPRVVVDLTRVAGASAIERRGGFLELGAMARQRAVERSALVRELCPLLAEALGHVGHVATRNRGTVVGSIAHAHPAAEVPAVALALDARIEAVSRAGRRTIPAGELFTGPLETSLRRDEVIESVRFPVTDGARTAFAELSRRSRDLPLAGAVVLVTLGGDGEVRAASLVGFGVGGTPARLPNAERALLGRRPTAGAIRAAAAEAAAEVEPLAEIHADARYGRELLATLLERALSKVAAA